MAAEMREDGRPGFGPYSTAEEVTQGIDASDKTALITGANVGIGAETARVLAMRGVRVVLAVRDLHKGESIKFNILNEVPHARLHVLQLDLSSMASIHSFCDTLKALKLPLNILMNNAGVLKGDFELSEDGYETHFAVNHLGHFLLTSLLLEEMKRTTIETGCQGRIINVTSKGHEVFVEGGGIQFDKINDKSSFEAWKAYGFSKLANILHANELTRRFKDEGVNMVANSVHPGLIYNTSIFRDVGKEAVEEFLENHPPPKPILPKTIPQGAATQCFVALHPFVEACSGKYFEDCEEATPSALCKNEKLAKDLWDFSVKATTYKAS